MDIYLAASIAGGRMNQDVVSGLLEFLRERKHTILDWFVAASGDWRDAFRENVGFSKETWEVLSPEKRRQLGFSQEMKWIEQADCLIAEVSAEGSYGVGGEIHHAYLKERLGLPLTPILCLYHQEGGEPTSTWIRGRNPDFVWLRPYVSLAEVQRIVGEFFEAFCLER